MHKNIYHRLVLELLGNLAGGHLASRFNGKKLSDLSGFEIIFSSFEVVFRRKIARSVVIKKLEKLAQNVLDQLNARIF